jgi:hypothetical protein
MPPEHGARNLGLRWLASAVDAGRSAWSIEWNRPMTPVLVPTGTAFDALELDSGLGLEIVSQLQCRGARIGAVGLDSRTSLVMFFVTPGSRERIALALRAAGQPQPRYHGVGDFVLVPPPTPCRLGPAQWLVLPGALGALTDVGDLLYAIGAASEVAELLNSSAYRPEAAPPTNRAEAGWVLA